MSSLVTSAAAGHAHDVGPVLEGLGKVADAADDVHMALHREGEDGLRVRRES